MSFDTITSKSGIPFNKISNKPLDEAMLPSIKLQVFDVKDYGALGNDSTDDTTAIQAALNACNSAGGGTVFFPKGTYITNPNIGLIVYSNTIIRGGGSSTIKVKNATNLDGNLLRIENRTNVKVENLILDGNKAGQTGSTNYGLYLSDSTNCLVDNVTTFNFSGVGTQIYDCDDCVVINSTSYSNGFHGFEIEQCRGTVVTNNVSYNNTRHGFYLAPGEIGGTGSKQCVISHNVSRNNSQYGISVGISVIGSTYLTQGCIIDSNQIYENSHYGVSLYQQDQQIIQNNVIRNNGFSGIYLYQSRLNKIEGNYLQNNSASANNGYDEIQIEGGSNGTGSQNNTIKYNTIITNNGSAKARYAIREAHASDNSNQIVYNSVFDSPATGRYLLNSKYIEYSGNYINTNTPLQTNSGGGQSVQSGFAGIDGEFGIMRIVNNKGNVPTQIVNQGTGNQEFFIDGAKKLEINTSNISAENSQIKNLATPTLSTDSATKGYVDTGLGTKQDTLVSGTNIKTVNGNSVLGSGNLVLNSSLKLLKTNTSSVISTTTETSLLGAFIGSSTILADSLFVNKTFKVSLGGYYSSLSGGAYYLRIKLNSTLIYGALRTEVIAETFMGFQFLITCRSIGSSGTIIMQGIGSDGKWGNAASSVSPITINTTINQVFDITYETATSSASNYCYLNSFIIEELN